METKVVLKEVRPQNGIPGLKHWRYDLLAGLQVTLLALPLALAIAIASGAPPVAGVISAIIAGIAFPFLGGAYITIGGPAVGLAPATLAGMFALGQGNLELGYPLLLVAVCLSGAVQVLLSRYDVGRLAMYFPSSVLQGMLMAIGILIIIQQIPGLLGQQNFSYMRDISQSIHRLPDQVLGLNQEICVVGALALTILFVLNSSRIKEHSWVRTSSPLLVAIWGGIAGWVLEFPKEYLISVPDDILNQGVRFPNFAAVWERPELWFTIFTTVIILTLINATESLATIRAIDKIDPFKRESNPNVILRTVGVSTMLSGLAGGLMIIPGGIKSTANMIAGGRTLWANAYYAVFTTLILWVGTALINRIPLTVLSALLIFIGWRLCAPAVFFRIWTIGKEQIFIALVCVMVTLFTSNLLVGVLMGVMTKVLLLCRDVAMALTLDPRFRAATHESFSACLIEALKELFRDPVIRIGDRRIASETSSLICESGGHISHPYKIYLSSISCMNVLKLDARLRELLAHVPPQHNFMLILRGHVVDHTAMEYLHHFRQYCFRSGYSCVIVGNEYFVSHSSHALAYRVNQAHETVV
ncbi:MAG: SulP family inorganic anion transporter [Nitrospira sp.]